MIEKSRNKGEKTTKKIEKLWTLEGDTLSSLVSSLAKTVTTLELMNIGD